MTTTLAALWRHPIKGHGRERLASVTLVPGQTLPWDRTWAVLREGADDPQGDWSPCNAFTRGAGSPQLMAITADLNEAAGVITLRHPDRPDITFDPDGETDAFLDWAAPLVAEGRPGPVRVVRAAQRGMTDTPFPSISICSTASLAALSDAVGHPLSPDRFRANLWLDGLEPWTEADLVGQDLRIGGATLRVEMRNTRCRATEANPDTGVRDADTLGALRKLWGHIDFGIYATVTDGGTIHEGDTVVLA
ncbi:molybdenum cofactor biosysynthesis protein [Meridianimarinicoccus roseus]|uniref:Molybdenum cofactor biosysynthesis protein n=1 Tax=Meridianimarinicoccus roseus TaxID=2072018 RepID=A0A2V2LFP8_9RHOB|nr:MOSC domain-containing protein [Meridianimarinicoccus roseus]PWR02017.1 molybdenum cofactor biosysynthesis protein [Meridianimarinicoccus roseus]